MAYDFLSQILILLAGSVVVLSLVRERLRKGGPIAAALSFEVSISSSRKAPRMPLRAASTLILCARAAWMTALAVAKRNVQMHRLEKRIRLVRSGWSVDKARRRRHDQNVTIHGGRSSSVEYRLLRRPPGGRRP